MINNEEIMMEIIVQTDMNINKDLMMLIMITIKDMIVHHLILELVMDNILQMQIKEKDNSSVIIHQMYCLIIYQRKSKRKESMEVQK